MTEPDLYTAHLSATVRRALTVGAGDLRELCVLCGGADPSRVSATLTRLGILETSLPDHRRSATLAAAGARAAAAKALALFPAANPEYAQWWFTLNSVERLCELVYLRTGTSSLALIGASSLAVYYASRFQGEAWALDIDKDVVDAINAATKRQSASVYDVANDLPLSLPNTLAAAVDPPWYSPYMAQFLLRASQLVQTGGYVFSTLPGELTRPEVLRQRDELVGWAREAGLALREVRPGFVEYGIPDFERAALQRFDRVQTKPWRYADLGVFEKTNEPSNVPQIEPAPTLEVFSRGTPKSFRVFLSPGRASTTVESILEAVPNYSGTVSRRDVARDTIALWTSTHQGFRIRDSDIARRALVAWQSTSTREEAFRSLTHDDSALLFLRTLLDYIVLPDNPDQTRRTPEEIARYRNASLSIWAEREPAGASNDGYRPRFARDRDRIIWSNGIRQLANKTQVFSTSESDYVRQRLTHSTEVMQLASTIGNSLGLDRDLIEAGALAHDIGHTPFGHAGENALDKVIQRIAPNVGGFNHYEHGLDVVRWLEDPYRHPAHGGKFGLELSDAILECIFKHTFCYEGRSISQTELLKKSKHTDRVHPGACHLEGQCVRAADKISYLISDIEDGLRLGAISIEDLRACRLFWHAPIDLVNSPGEDPLASFVAQRRSIIALLMQDLIDESARKLASYTGPEQVRIRNEYTINHSAVIAKELSEVWERVQVGRLHRDPRVIASNRKAAEVVSRLLLIFTLQPNLIDAQFRRHHHDLRTTKYMEWYRERSNGFAIRPDVEKQLFLDVTIGADRRASPTIEDLVQAKDYVASLTDHRARKIYASLFSTAESPR